MRATGRRAWHNMPVRRINVKAQAADAGAVREVVRALRGGALVALPTETVYGIGADASHTDATARLAALKGRDAAQPVTLHLASGAALEQHAVAPKARVRALLDRYWPGPLTVVLPQPTGGTVGLRVPAHPFTSAVLAEFDGGLLLTSANRHGEPPMADADAIARGFPTLDLVCDAGPPALGHASAVVRATGPLLEVLREGTLLRAELLRTAAVGVLFVCTGNTCRSPMAAAVAGAVMAETLDVQPDQLLARGVAIASAGTSAWPGEPASEHAVTVCAELGLDLSAHRSQPVTPELVASWQRIYALTDSHLERLIRLAPAAAGRAQLLAQDGRSIPDPFGADLETYRRTRDAIATAVRSRASEIAAAVDA